MFQFVSERWCAEWKTIVKLWSCTIVLVGSLHTAFRCVPPTATYLQYRVIGLTPMAVGLSQSLAQRSGIVSRILSGTRQSALTLSHVCWRRICLRNTISYSALEVDNFMRWINYLLTYCTRSIRQSVCPSVRPFVCLSHTLGGYNLQLPQREGPVELSLAGAWRWIVLFPCSYV